MKTITTVIIVTVSITPLAAQWVQYHTPGIPLAFYYQTPALIVAEA